MEPREFLSGASVTAPTRPTAPSTGYPSGGSPGTGVAPTVPGPYWFHQIGEELRAVIAAAGISPSGTDLTQLLTALRALFGGSASGVTSTVAKGHWTGPGGLTLQWGSKYIGNPAAGTQTASETFHTAFTSAPLPPIFTFRDASSVDGGCNIVQACDALTSSGFTWKWAETGASSTQDATLWYIALGYKAP